MSNRVPKWIGKTLLFAGLLSGLCLPALAKPTEIRGSVICFSGLGNGIEVGTVHVEANFACPAGVDQQIGTTTTGSWAFTFPDDCLGGVATVTFLGQPQVISVAPGSIITFPQWHKFCEGDPYPGSSDVPQVAYSPGGTWTYTVTIRDLVGDPVSGATVRLDPTAAAEPLISWCAGQSHQPEATTDYQGNASFTIFAGGCIDPALLGDDAFTVSAEKTLNPGYGSEVELGGRGAVSSDAVNEAGLLPTDPGYEKDAGSGLVQLDDAVFHTGPISTSVYSFCTDFNSDGVVDVSDSIILTSDVVDGVGCTLE